LPEFLATLRVGAPAIWIFFDVFIREHGLEGPTSMIQVQDIFGEKPVSVKIGDEEFIHPCIYTFAYRHGFAWRRCRMSGHNHPNVRQALT